MKYKLIDTDKSKAEDDSRDVKIKELLAQLNQKVFAKNYQPDFNEYTYKSKGSDSNPHLNTEPKSQKSHQRSNSIGDLLNMNKIKIKSVSKNSS